MPVLEASSSMASTTPIPGSVVDIGAGFVRRHSARTARVRRLLGALTLIDVLAAAGDLDGISY
jgi:hypothetical protein